MWMGWKTSSLLLFSGLVGLTLHAGPLRASPLTPADIVDRWAAHLQTVTDYEFVMETESVEGKKTEHATLHVWVRRPELVRVRVLKGAHRGSEISLCHSGKVIARSGGILGAIKVSMSKTDSRLRDSRGDYAWQSDWGTACHKLRECLHSSEKSECRVLSDGHEEITCTYPDPISHVERREVWTFDSSGPYLLERDAYENGTRVEHVTYRDWKENLGLRVSFFDL